MSRRTIPAPSWSSGWGEGRSIQVEETKATGGDHATYVVYLNGVRIGTVSRYNGTAERPTHRGSRIVTRGKPGAQKQWRYQLDATRQRPFTWRETRAEAIQDMLRRLDDAS